MTLLLLLCLLALMLTCPPRSSVPFLLALALLVVIFAAGCDQNVPADPTVTTATGTTTTEVHP